MNDHQDDQYYDARKSAAKGQANKLNISKREVLEFHSVEAKAKMAVADIFDKWERLNWIVERYELILQRRWMKKKREQRKKVLLAAWPNMSVMHRPDFYALRHETHAQRLAETRFRDAFLYPFINLEDLCRPKNLLLLLNSRGRHMPDTFALLDLNMSQIGSSSCAIVTGYLPGYTMALTGHKTRESYGRLVYREDESSVSLMKSKSFEYRAGDGLLILEIQQTVLGFLITCAEIILQDITLDQNVTTPVVPAPPLDLFREETGTEWGSLGVAYAEVPYRTPEQLDVTRLRRLASARRAEAEDHIWALREDPGYFQEVLQDQSEHRVECIQTLSGKQHPDLGRPVYYWMVIQTVMLDSHRTLVQWDHVLRELTQLEDIRGRYGDAILSMERLPEDYGAALWYFFLLLESMIKAPVFKLNHCAVASPSLRKHYTRMEDFAIFDVVLRQPVKHDYLLWLLERVRDKDRLYFLFDLFDELERVTRADPVEHTRISSYMAGTLSEMAALEDIQRSLVFHHPNICTQYDEAGAEEVFQRYAARIHAITDVIYNANVQLFDVGVPFAKFDYPSWKKRTRPVHMQLCAAEANLDHFWNTVDAHYEQQTGKSLRELLEGFVAHRDLQRTPPWTALMPEPASPTATRTVEQFSHQDFEERHWWSVGSEELPIVKTKFKTRRTASEPVPRDTQEPSVVEATPGGVSPVTFQVTRRAHKVLSALFSSPGVTCSLGDVPWKDFLFAMASVGFGITKLHGSAWLFQPSWSKERPIIFHEPHPASRIQFHHLRRHGRRLGRAYGWGCHTFDLVKRQ